MCQEGNVKELYYIVEQSEGVLGGISIKQIISMGGWQHSDTCEGKQKVLSWLNAKTINFILFYFIFTSANLTSSIMSHCSQPDLHPPPEVQ